MKLHDWENHHVLHRNRLPGRSYFIPYMDESSALTCERGNSEYFQLLNGIWKFHFAPTPAYSPERFFEDSYDASGWDSIPVPGCWQFHGYRVRLQAVFRRSNCSMELSKRTYEI